MLGWVIWAIYGGAILSLVIVIKTYLDIRKEERTGVEYVCGFVGKPTNNMTYEEMQREAIRLRDEARKHMEEMGFHFDYTEADRKNQARREKRQAQLEEIAEQFKEEYMEQRHKGIQAQIIEIAEYRRVTNQPTENRRRERGISVLYPTNKNFHPDPPRPKRRKRLKKRDGTSTYQLGLDVSPVYGIKPQADKTIQNYFTTYEEPAPEVIEDDYPQNIEEAYEEFLHKTQAQVAEERRLKQKQEIINRKYGMKEYLQTVREYDELKKRLSKAM